MTKRKEFQWNKLPKLEYLYFLHARLVAHLSSFRLNDANCFYPCLKTNGDLNTVMKNFKPEGMAIATGKVTKLIGILHENLLCDILTGQFGQFAYFIEYKKGLEILRKAPARAIPQLARQISAYRASGKSPANDYFNDFAEDAIIADPVTWTGKSRQKLFGGQKWKGKK